MIEVSSHALDQQRIAGIAFDGALITTIGRDHFDYHKNLAGYLRTKVKLLEMLPEGAPAVIPETLDLPEDVDLSDLSILSFSVDSETADGWAEIIEEGFEGSEVRLHLPRGEELGLRLRQPGRYNVSNAVAVALLARALGISLEAIVDGLEQAPSIPGRLEEVEVPVGRVFVDFAHTPDALEALLESVRPWVVGRLHLLFGCGGGRDQGKRKVMGEVASRLADRLIVTSDNPRFEDPQKIIDETMAGVSDEAEAVDRVDRRQAIAEALTSLGDGDVLLISGKGHEDTQEIRGSFQPFDDRRVVAEYYSGEMV